MSADNPYRAYPVLLSVRDAAALLSDAADLHPTAISTVSADDEHGGAGVIVELDAGTTPVTMIYTADGVRLSEWDHRLLSNLSRERRQHHQRHRDKVGADVDTLRRYRLPLYWNHQWRAEKYEETTSFNALAEKYKREVQGARGASIHNFDRRFIDGRRAPKPGRQRRLSRRDQFVEHYEAGHDTETQAAMAKHFRVTKSTISRWIRELTAIYQELMNSPALRQNEQALVEFAVNHKIDDSILRRWLNQGSSIFQEAPEAQPKAKYYTRDEYDQLFERFEELYRQADGNINQSKVARELNVDRSTIREWRARIETSAYQPAPPE